MPTRQTLNALLTLIFVFASYTAAQAFTLHTFVSRNGSNANAGTETSPFATF